MAYTTIAEVRATIPRMASTQYTDDMITSGIEYVTAVVDEYCGTSFEYKAGTKTIYGACGTVVYGLEFGLPHFLQTITSVLADGVSQTLSNYSVIDNGAYIKVENDSFSPDVTYTIAYTAGQYSAIPDDMKTAVIHYVAHYVQALKSALPDGALQVISDQGTILIANPGVRGPSGVPMVNSVLNRHRIDPRWF